MKTQKCQPGNPAAHHFVATHSGRSEVSAVSVVIIYDVVRQRL